MSSDTFQHSFALPTTRTIGDAVSFSTEQHSLAQPSAPRPPFLLESPHQPGPDRKNQRPPKTNSDRQLAKSTSTPYLRGPTMSESELDKKRNKLGYQRISIACAHCRRRKIRCLLAEDNSEQRCQNCIRLKKECVFYPVDQQAVLDARSESSSKSGAPSAPSSSISTSPTQQGARGFDHHVLPGAFHASPMPSTSASFQGIHIGPIAGMPSQSTAGFATSGPVYADSVIANYSPQPYTMHAQQSSQWNPADFAGHNRHPPVARASSTQPSFARYPSAQAPDVAPYPGPQGSGQDPSIMPDPQYSYGTQQMQQPPPNWQSQSQPDRAISYPEYATNFSPNQQVHTLPSSYARQPILQSPMPAMMPMQQTMPLHSHQQYGQHHDQRRASMPAPLPPQQVNWFRGAPSQSPVDEVVRRLPSNYPPNAWNGRPT